MIPWLLCSALSPRQNLARLPCDAKQKWVIHFHLLLSRCSSLLSLEVVVFFELSQCMPRHSFQQTQEEYDV
jgi:hypothetical protein